jgi:hypothetical protein
VKRENDLAARAAALEKEQRDLRTAVAELAHRVRLLERELVSVIDHLVRRGDRDREGTRR